MPTSLKTLSKYASEASSKLTTADKSYFRARTRLNVHSAVLGVFMDKAEREGFTKAQLAKRLGASPAQVTKWLASSGNWQLDTISDLLLAMNHWPEFAAEEIESAATGNFVHELCRNRQDADEVMTISNPAYPDVSSDYCYEDSESVLQGA